MSKTVILIVIAIIALVILVGGGVLIFSMTSSGETETKTEKRTYTNIGQKQPVKGYKGTSALGKISYEDPIKCQYYCNSYKNVSNGGQCQSFIWYNKLDPSHERYKKCVYYNKKASDSDVSPHRGYTGGTWYSV